MADKVAYEFDPIQKVMEKFGIEIPESKQAKAMEAIADYVKEEVLLRVGAGKSPVEDGPWKRGLSTPYKTAKGEISSANFANLELSGEMLDALEVVIANDKLTLQIEGEQAAKAEGNNIGSYGRDPNEEKARRFIPLDGETFIPAIWKGIAEIAKDFSND